MPAKKAVKKSAKKMKLLVPDTSVVAEGLVSTYIQDKKITATTIIISEAVMNELENHANKRRDIGYAGLEEIKKLQGMKSIAVEFDGTRPGEFEIKFASSGAVDNMIRELARARGATLMTADRVQSLVAEALGLDVLYVDFRQNEQEDSDPLAEYFDATTMSVHVREDTPTISKKGKPGAWEFVESKNSPDRHVLRDLQKAIIDACHHRKDGFVEIERHGSTIVQLGKYRIVMTKPPFASAWEVTAVRPVAHLTLKDYEYPEKFGKRLEESAEGILVAGSPGEGKSTFVQALGEFYVSMQKIVKTVESPRDLVLPKSVTQYSMTHGTPEEVRDVLLLNRPDYTIYDEIRNTKDFQLFADMRLAGVGMIGVVHAAEAVDAIQRFIGRVELGMIPQIIDTVVFIKAGAIAKVYTIDMQVKTPAGMTEADLARPVVIVKDFYSDTPEFEIYSYGDQTTVVPVTGDAGVPPLHKLAEMSIENYFNKFTDSARAKLLSEGKAVVYVPEGKIAKIIGKGGVMIEAIQKDLNMSLDIKSLSEMPTEMTGDSRTNRGVDESGMEWEAITGKKSVTLLLPRGYKNKEIDLYADGNYIMTVQASKDAKIKVATSSGAGKRIKRAVNDGDLEVRA